MTITIWLFFHTTIFFPRIVRTCQNDPVTCLINRFSYFLTIRHETDPILQVHKLLSQIFLLIKTKSVEFNPIIKKKQDKYSHQSCLLNPEISNSSTQPYPIFRHCYVPIYERNAGFSYQPGICKFTWFIKSL